MKKVLLLLTVCIVTAISAFTVSSLWNVSSEGVIINFELPENGTKGTLSGLKATIDFNPNDISASKIEASVDVSTLNTGNTQKDDHLKNPDFFDVAKYPLIKFSSSSIKATKDGFVATGGLTMKDSTQIIEIPFTFTEDATGGVLKGGLTILPSDYGVTKKGKDSKVVITINVPVKK